MPLPSGGCQTCRARRIKCDETRPECLNCRKSGRHCAGWRSETGSHLFLSENKYASTSIRRPRGGARWVPEFSAGNAETPDKLDSVREPSPNTSSDLVVRQGPGCSNHLIQAGIPSGLHESLEDLALQYFGLVYFREKEISVDSIWSITKQYFPASAQLAQDSLPQLAFLSLSLTNYGRTYGIPAAITKAQQRYSSTLYRLHKAIGNRQAALSDEMLAAVMIMAAYENNSAHFDHTKLYSYSFEHHMGAMVLLQIRQQHRAGECLPNSIDQCVRRQVIRGCIYRATPVPDWLCDGAQFGEADHHLGLDSAFVRLAALRSEIPRVLYYNKELSSPRDSPIKVQIEKLIAEAVEILQQLTDWRTSLDIRHQYTVSYGSPINPGEGTDTLFYSSELYQFCGGENAAMWNWYQGTRLSASCILLKLIFIWKHLIREKRDEYLTLAQWAHADVGVTANEICASVPFAFDVDYDCEKDLPTVLRDAVPSSLYNLSWPFVVANVCQVLDDVQRQWIREKLILVSRVTGNATLDKLANMNLHQHTQLSTKHIVRPKEDDSPPNTLCV